MVTCLEEWIEQYLCEQCVVTSAQAVEAEHLGELPLRYETIAGELLKLGFIVLQVDV